MEEVETEEIYEGASLVVPQMGRGHPEEGP
jgi:hypothetical protein